MQRLFRIALVAFLAVFGVLIIMNVSIMNNLNKSNEIETEIEIPKIDPSAKFEEQQIIKIPNNYFSQYDNYTNIIQHIMCPSTFVYDRILKCNELRMSFMFGNCEMNKCEKCFPPNLIDESKNMAVKNFKDIYKSTKKKRHNKLLNLLISNNIKPYNNYPLIIMVMNGGYGLLFYNWVCSLENHNLNYIKKQTLIIATDNKAKNIAIKSGFNIIYELNFMKNAGLNIGKETYSGMEAKFGKLGNSYNYLVSLQIAIISDLIELNYNILFQDIDIVWIKDPIPYIIVCIYLILHCMRNCDVYKYIDT